ncbi:MAG: endolytic transglycosylase MltG [Lachnospiraceae bacterium]|nr:endolytic transglycosylase MltG [Lachnospiraceae bacterium]MBQ4069135.1 hypothetical protein [Lachnospiraceae bacterium]
MKSKKDIKLKYYLRGLGTGIVITTLVLTISFNVRSCTAKDNKEETTKEISADENTTKETTADEKMTKDTTKDKSTEEKTTKEKTTKEKTTKEETTEKQTEETTEEPTSKEKPTEEPTTENAVTNKKVIFTISSGMSSELVSANLERDGLVDSANEFNRYLYQMGYERILRVGTYEIEVGSSYEEIAQIITN